ncbi:MAG: 2-C-methyl-D-erythritol 4-phosphate cytidylyltransferase [Bacillota bacterium]|nr:2-C-methyl-D-erythritol 4-phosphate cytidylyltransferase [Bacillota bacterium]HPF18025.1 2-C-methyl-D-erythritol 4-phosphate cytidylyltransferase [Bacillota bacterium]
MIANQKVAVIIAAAGSGSRMGGGVLKQHIKINGTPMAVLASKVFLRCEEIDCLVYVGEKNAPVSEALFGSTEKEIIVAEGGRRRQDSVANGLRSLPRDVDIVLVHDGARPFITRAMIRRVLEGVSKTGAAIPCVAPIATLRTRDQTLDRSELYEVQTPQGFRKDLLEQGFVKAEAEGRTVTDEASLMELIGIEVSLVEGSYGNIKVTNREDLPMRYRTGIGYDVHRLVSGRPLWLGCVEIPYEQGLLGHSDADVIAHAVADALLGAAAMGDIGLHFPDSDDRCQNMSGKTLLAHTARLLQDAGFTISSIDATLSCEQPKIAPYTEEMRLRMARALDIDAADVSIKATTQEGLGFSGRGEGMSALATALICQPADGPDIRYIRETASKEER